MAVIVHKTLATPLRDTLSFLKFFLLQHTQKISSNSYSYCLNISENLLIFVA